MSSTVALVIAGLLVAYLLSAGVAFAVMYRVGARFPSRLAGVIYAPLEWLSGAGRHLHHHWVHPKMSARVRPLGVQL